MTITRDSGTVLDPSVPGGDTVQEAITKNSDALDSVITQANADIATKGEGDMLSTNNLSDLTSNATALTNLGGTSVGLDLFTASNAGTARTTLGSGTTGDAVFLASNAATAQQAMDVEVGVDVQAYDATILNASDIDVEVTDFVFSAEGDLVYYSSNASTRLAVGGEEQVLTSISGIPSWRDPAAGGMWELVQKQTPSAVASVDFTGLSGDYDYKLIINDIDPVTQSDLVMRLGTGATPTWIVSYSYALSWVDADGGSGSVNNAVGASIVLMPTLSTTEINYVEATIGSFAESSPCSIVTRASANSNAIRKYSYGGATELASTARTAIQVFMGTGNINSGIVALYRRERS